MQIGYSILYLISDRVAVANFFFFHMLHNAVVYYFARRIMKEESIRSRIGHLYPYWNALWYR